MFKTTIKILLYLFVPLIVSLVTLVILSFIFLEPVNRNDSQSRLILVSPEESFRQISKDLQRQGIIRNSWALNLIAQLSRKDKSVMAGEYEFSPAMTLEQILDKMITGKMFLRKVTIKEGDSIWELAQDLQSAGIIQRPDFEPVLTDPRILKDLHVEAASLEGYLFPETYQFPRGVSAYKIVATMVQQLESHWTAPFDSQAKELAMSKHQILTLASIIEKEAGNEQEMPLISSVFNNRIKKGMRLQADPTVIYGIANFNGNLTREDLLTFTPYNTYVISGLPPGPIANPGIKAIEAALYPAKTEYLFFVANGMGSHIFTEKLEDHNKAVSTYQRGAR